MKLSFKLIAVLCSLLCLSGVFSVFVCAVDEDMIDPEDISTVEEQVAGELVGAEDGSDITVENNANIYDADGDGSVTPAEIASVFAKYAFASEESLEGYADDIAEASTFTVTVTKDGVSTVYIAVPVESYPQLFNSGVFDETVQKLAEKQDEYKTEDMTLMSYEHIAGELALHAALYAAAYLVGGDKEDSKFHSYYESAKTADLNIDEERVSSGFIDFIGKLITFFHKLLAFFNNFDPHMINLNDF